MNNERTYKRIGTFITGPSMLVTDPCYDKGTWCNHTVKNCLAGKWIAAVNVNNYPWKRDDEVRNDYRIATLFVKHESLPASYAVFNRIHWNNDTITYRDGWELLSEYIGVDSGQAGFFDFDKFGDNDLFDSSGDCGFGEYWYSNCCDATLSPKQVGIIANMGVNSSAGYGDGCYSLWGHKRRDGSVDAMALFFLPDTETEDEEEETTLC